VMARVPWIRFIFTLTSAALLFFWGIRSDDNIVLGLSMILLLALPHHYRMAKISSGLLRERKNGMPCAQDSTSAAAEIYAFFKKPAFQKWKFNTKLSVGYMMLPRFIGRMPNGKETVIGLVIYAACIVLPFAALAAIIRQSPQTIRTILPQVFHFDSPATTHAPVVKQSEKERQARIDAYLQEERLQRKKRLQTASKEERFTVMKDLIEDAHESGDIVDAQYFANLMYTESANAPASYEHALAANLLSWIILEDGKPETSKKGNELSMEAESIMRERLSHATDAKDVGDEELLADILQQRADGIQANDTNKEIRLQLRQEIVATLSRHANEHDTRLSGARVQLAMILDDTGHMAEAEAELRSASKAVEAGISENHYPPQAQLDYGWFLIAHQRPSEVDPLIAAYLKSPVFYIHSQKEILILSAAAALSRNDWDSAKKRATDIREMPAQTSSPNWVTQFFVRHLSAPPFQHDIQATMILIEAERALHNDQQANDIVTEIRPLYQDGKHQPACKLRENDNLWRHDFFHRLALIEQREMQCRLPREATCQ
jgi:hypothetical protein